MTEERNINQTDKELINLGDEERNKSEERMLSKDASKENLKKEGKNQSIK